MLKAMRRTYDRDRYMKRVEMIREHVPDCAITTDIIVGFPGETEEDFQQTMEVVDEVGYDSAFTFMFSPRRGTEAATMPGQLPHAVKRERMERLVDAGSATGAGARQPFPGHDPGGAGGRTEPDRPGQAARSHAPQQDGQLHGPGTARRAGPGRDHRRRRRPRLRATSRCCRGEPTTAPCSRASVPGGPAASDLRADRGRQDRGRDRAGGPVARARRAAGGRVGGRLPALRGLDVLVAKPSDEQLAGSSTGWCRWSRSAVSSAWLSLPSARRPRSMPCWRRVRRRSWSAAPGSTCVPPSPSSTCARRPTPACGSRSSARWPSWATRRCTRNCPGEVAAGVHPNDRKRIVRALELERMGSRAHERSEQLWSRQLRHQTRCSASSWIGSCSMPASPSGSRACLPVARRGGGAGARRRRLEDGAQGDRLRRDRGPAARRGGAGAGGGKDRASPSPVRQAPADMDAQAGGRAAGGPQRRR